MSFTPLPADFTVIPPSFPVGVGSLLESRTPILAPLPPVALPTLASTPIWGVDFSVVTMPQAIDYLDRVVQRRLPSYAITANLNYLMLCARHRRLADFTRQAAIVLCDGMPILWRSRLTARPLPERVAGSDLIYRLAERSAERGYRVFFLGGVEGIARKAADKLRQLFPRLMIAGVECPPFRPLTHHEHAALSERIRASRADILLVAFGQPKGEFWIEENFRQLGVPLSIQLGASFDFIAGQAKRAPHWMQRVGLEWFYRMVHDPQRLLPRYAQNSWFLLKQLHHDLLRATQ